MRGVSDSITRADSQYFVPATVAFTGWTYLLTACQQVKAAGFTQSRVKGSEPLKIGAGIARY